ncbi:hypothetical protein K439DRAFT_869362 [Ramaria rubella]|nr:hypothetical protein K439DRAFT_869362 [Ramaria rubella]
MGRRLRIRVRVHGLLGLCARVRGVLALGGRLGIRLCAAGAGRGHGVRLGREGQAGHCCWKTVLGAEVAWVLAVWRGAGPHAWRAVRRWAGACAGRGCAVAVGWVSCGGGGAWVRCGLVCAGWAGKAAGVSCSWREGVLRCWRGTAEGIVVGVRRGRVQRGRAVGAGVVERVVEAAGHLGECEGQQQGGRRAQRTSAGRLGMARSGIGAATGRSGVKLGGSGGRGGREFWRVGALKSWGRGGTTGAYDMAVALFNNVGPCGAREKSRVATVARVRKGSSRAGARAVATVRKGSSRAVASHTLEGIAQTLEKCRCD